MLLCAVVMCAVVCVFVALTVFHFVFHQCLEGSGGFVWVHCRPDIGVFGSNKTTKDALPKKQNPERKCPTGRRDRTDHVVASGPKERTGRRRGRRRNTHHCTRVHVQRRFGQQRFEKKMVSTPTIAKQCDTQFHRWQMAVDVLQRRSRCQQRQFKSQRYVYVGMNGKW